MKVCISFVTFQKYSKIQILGRLMLFVRILVLTCGKMSTSHLCALLAHFDIA